MPKLPAICDSCGAAVLSDVRIRDDTFHLQDSDSGACSCGGKLRIPGGTYSHLGGPLNYCNAPDEDLQKFCTAMDQLDQDYFCRQGDDQ